MGKVSEEVTFVASAVGDDGVLRHLVVSAEEAATLVAAGASFSDMVLKKQDN